MDSSAETDADLRARVRQQEFVAELGQRALEADDLDRLLADAAAGVAETLAADYCAIFECPSDGTRTWLRRGVGWREGSVGNATVAADRDSQVGATLDRQRPVVVEDLPADERFVAPDLLARHDVTGGLTALVGSGDDPWGVLGVYATERREFTEHDADFVRSVGDVLGSAVENERTQSELEEIYGRISDAFFALDREWRFTYVNERAHEVINPEGRALVGENIWEAFPEATSRKFESEYERAMYEQETVSFEEYYPEPLDAWFEVRAYPSETGLSVYFRDVTERKQREQELELFRTLLDHSTDSVLVVDPGTGRYLDVNDTACQRRGYSREEFLTLSVTDVETEFPDRESWRSFVADLRSEGQITFGGRHRRADGTTYPVEVNASHVELDREYVVAVSRDATERRERERELRREQRRFEAVFEDPNILVGLLDPDGTVLDINGTAMEYVDADLDAVTGEPFWETPWWGAGDDVRADVRRWTERAAAGEYVDFEADLTRPDGERYTLNGVFRPVTDDDGDVVSIVVSDRDITERRKRERELEESERRYRTLVDHFPNGAVALVDEDMRYRTVGGDPVDVADVTAEDLKGEPVREVLSEALAEELAPRYEAALDGTADAFEVDLDGRTFQFQTVPVRDDDGEVFAALGMSQDVTERVEAQRKLAESERRYRALAEYFPNGLVTLFDDDLRYTLAAGQGFDRIPVDPDDLEGSSVREAWDDATADTLEPALEAILDGDERSVELEYEGREWILHAVPITDERGDVFAGMTMAQDVTERVEAQRKLEESERRYRTLVENFPNGAVALFDEDLRYTVAGGAVLGDVDTSPSEIVGQTVQERYPPEVAARLEPDLRAALDGESNTAEVAFHERHWRVHTLPVEDDDGDVFAGMMMAQDVTEQVERERKLEETVADLEESNDRLESFASMLAHELRNPVTIGQIYSQQLPDETDAEAVEYVTEAFDRIEDMIDVMLVLTRGRDAVGGSSPVDLADAARAAWADVDAPEASIDVEVDRTVRADETYVRHLFRNLFENSVEHGSTSNRPESNDTVEHGGADVTVTVGDLPTGFYVADDGVGIPEDERDAVFDEGYTTAGESGGTGLGLAFVRELADIYGWACSVTESESGGARFEFTNVDDGASESD